MTPQRTPISREKELAIKIVVIWPLEAILWALNLPHKLRKK